jgi:hypothetical protein
MLALSQGIEDGNELHEGVERFDEYYLDPDEESVARYLARVMTKTSARWTGQGVPDSDFYFVSTSLRALIRFHSERASLLAQSRPAGFPSRPSELH